MVDRVKLATFAILFVAVVSILMFSLSLGTPKPTERAVINNRSIALDVADTADEREKGLSGTAQLQSNRGLLFVFEDTGYWSFWMKDMNYSIDIIWFNESRRVIHLEEKVSPNTYPRQFVPNTPAKYVLEIPAGRAKEYDIKLGDQATFYLP
ncbi:hypothetical protein CYG49_04920 [Candidatus Saccharibacteria bacterium]|nr:MAG: hypothetical protein CYG49_04920 [Candidatus Saccharibacteria bacterium]